MGHLVKSFFSRFFFEYTPQNKHGSPENGGPLEKEIPIGNPSFPGSMLIFGGVSGETYGILWPILKFDLSTKFRPVLVDEVLLPNG